MRAMQADKFGGYADLRLVDVVKPAAAEGRLENGTYCEYVSVRKQNLCLVPENILPVEAAGLPVAYATAYLARVAVWARQGRAALARGSPFK